MFIVVIFTLFLFIDINKNNKYIQFMDELTFTEPNTDQPPLENAVQLVKLRHVVLCGVISTQPKHKCTEYYCTDLTLQWQHIVICKGCIVCQDDKILLKHARFCATYPCDTCDLVRAEIKTDNLFRQPFLSHKRKVESEKEEAEKDQSENSDEKEDSDDEEQHPKRHLCKPKSTASAKL